MFYFYEKNKLMIKITFLQASTLFTYFHCTFILHRFEKYCLKNRFISVTWHYIPNHTISLQNMLNTLWQYFIRDESTLTWNYIPGQRSGGGEWIWWIWRWFWGQKTVLDISFWKHVYIYIGFPLYVLISVYTCTCI